MQDLHVVDILPQMITLSEAYIQIWAKRKGEKVKVDKPANGGEVKKN